MPGMNKKKQVKSTLQCDCLVKKLARCFRKCIANIISRSGAFANC